MKRIVTPLLLVLLVLAAFSGPVAADTETYQIAASADDTIASSGNNYSSIAYVYWPSPSYNGYLRWEIDIPAGATITDAYVSFYGYVTSSATPTVRMQLLDYDDCPSFSSNPYTWDVSTTYVDWAISGWTAYQWMDSPDITDLVQEFIDRTGYETGNYLGLRGVLQSGDNLQRACSYDWSGNAHGPKLAVTYTTNLAPTADAGEDQTVADTDGGGDESVTLDGSGSSDSDGTISSYVWTENSTQIATGSGPSVTLSVAVHTITLTVTDDDDATDTDTVVITVEEAPGTEVHLDLTDSFNMDVICGPKEFQECLTDGSADYIDLFGDYDDGNGDIVLGSARFLIAETSTTAMAYSISGYSGGHPLNYSSSQALPDDGVVSGADVDYHMSSSVGNDTVSGDMTEVSDPSTYDVKSNAICVGARHNKADWQVSSVTVELPSAQKRKYAEVNFTLAAMNMAHKARNMRIVALYGATGSDTETLYSFSTASGGSGPVITDTTAPTDFAIVHSMTKAMDTGTGTTGQVRDVDCTLFEFDAAFEPDDTKDLWGFRFEDVDPSLNWAARGMVIFAATAVTPGGNEAPVADAGADQTVTDTDDNGSENVTLDGSGSSDSDGTIASYVWEENSSQIATGSGPTVSMTTGTHTITLTVTDDDDATDTDSVTVKVNERPFADAGDDQTVNDSDDSGAENVTLDGSGSDDSDGSICSYVWKENSTQIATGVGPTVSLTVAAHTIELTVTDDDSATDTDTMVATVTAYVNIAPTADAGEDQTVTDTDDGGDESVTLDGSGSTDSDGTIESYVWTENSTQIATGSGPSVTLSVAVHTITLTVTDDDDATDTDTVVIAVEAAPGGEVQLDLTDSFNMDVICGPKEFQECLEDGSHDYIDLFGDYDDGNCDIALGSSRFLIAETSTTAMAYSISGYSGGHPLNYSSSQALPDDGVLTGADVDYHMSSSVGNDTVSGDWTEVSDPSTYDVKSNAICVGARHNKADWQVSSVTAELPSAQKGKYTEVNFALAAMNMAHRARNMRIVALYGSTGSDTETLYSFSTASGGSGPVMTDTTAPTDFAIVHSMTKAMDPTTGSTGQVRDQDCSLFEFDEVFELDDTKDLWGFRFEDVDPDLNWAARGMVIFAATAVSAGGNQAPTADAGADQTVTDTDDSGSESVTLDGSGSADSDGTISSYVWKENSTQIATGSGPSVSLTTGTHTIELTVTDDDSATDTDTVVVTVNVRPSADAGDDQTVTDTDDNGSESVTLDGSGSSDSDGTIASYVWEENSTQIATGSGPSVSLSVAAHTITLTVTDDDSATDTDDVVITVNAPSSANEYYLDPATGDDEDAGTSSAPWETWSHAQSQLEAGDTLYCTGTLGEIDMTSSDPNGTSSAPITYAAWSGKSQPHIAELTFDGTVKNAYLVFDGFKFDPGYVTTAGLTTNNAVNLDGASHVTFDGCYFEGPKMSGMTGDYAPYLVMEGTPPPAVTAGNPGNASYITIINSTFSYANTSIRMVEHPSYPTKLVRHWLVEGNTFEEASEDFITVGLSGDSTICDNVMATQISRRSPFHWGGTATGTFPAERSWAPMTQDTTGASAKFYRISGGRLYVYPDDEDNEVVRNNSYVWRLDSDPTNVYWTPSGNGDSTHVDCIAVQGATENLIVARNWMETNPGGGQAFKLDYVSGQPTDILIENNMFICLSEAPTYLILIQGGSDTIFRHNTVYPGPNAPLARGIRFLEKTGGEWTNLQFYNNIISGAVVSSGEATSDYNLWMSTPPSAFNAGSNTITVSGVSGVDFVDESNGDFDLESTSDAVDAGDPDEAPGVDAEHTEGIDYEGLDRDGSPDMGAYEYQSS